MIGIQFAVYELMKKFLLGKDENECEEFDNSNTCKKKTN